MCLLCPWFFISTRSEPLVRFVVSVSGVWSSKNCVVLLNLSVYKLEVERLLNQYNFIITGGISLVAVSTSISKSTSSSSKLKKYCDRTEYNVYRMGYTLIGGEGSRLRFFGWRSLDTLLHLPSVRQPGTPHWLFLYRFDEASKRFSIQQMVIVMLTKLITNSFAPTCVRSLLTWTTIFTLASLS